MSVFHGPANGFMHKRVLQLLQKFEGLQLSGHILTTEVLQGFSGLKNLRRFLQI
jgi:hypothetical protein